MTKFLKLPVYFSSGDPEELERQREKAEDLGIPFKPEKEKGFMYVELSTIKNFNQDSGGRTTIELSDGYRQQVMMRFEDFVEMIKNAGGEIIE